MADYSSTSSNPSNPSTVNNTAWTPSNMSSTHSSPIGVFAQHTPEAPILSLALAVDISASPASIDDITGTPALFDSLNLDVSTMPVSTNTIAPQDFCLYERMDTSAFDFPLFGESFKQQKLKQGSLFQNQMTDEEFTLVLDMQQQQQMEQFHSIQSHAMALDGQSAAAAAVGSSLYEQPLIPADMAFGNPLSASSSANKVSFGFDSLAALMDDSAFDLSHAQAQVPFHHQYQQQHTQVYYTPANASDTPLLDAPSTPCINSPFSPSLDTPAMPHLGFKFGGDFGCGDQTPLFGSGGPMFPFQLPIQFGHGMPQGSGCDMVAPQSTLLNASPNPPAPITFGGLGETAATDLINVSTLHIKKEAEDIAKISLSPLSVFLSATNSPLLSDDDDSDDDDFDDSDDMDFKDEPEDEDMEPYDTESPAPGSSAATSATNTVVSFVYSGKRKLHDASRPALFSARRTTPLALDRHPSVSGDNDNDSEIDVDDHQADTSYIPVASFVHNRKRKSKAAPVAASPVKRTRPALASPYGGNFDSSSSSSSATAKQLFDTETFASSPLSNQEESDDFPPAQQSSNKRSSNGVASSKKASSNSDSYRPYVCEHPDCGRAFNRLFNLRSHVRTHDPNSERPYVCEEVDCNKAFTRKHDLQRHQTSVHQGQRRYVCDTCKKSFSRQDGLRRHYRREINSCAPGRIEGVPGDDYNGIDDEYDDDSSDASDTENDQHLIEKSSSHDTQASDGLEPSSIKKSNPTFPWNPGDQTAFFPQSLPDQSNPKYQHLDSDRSTHISLRQMTRYITI
ncbi:hypothetical protein BGZ96_011694 [Linnemannia gamsii]|uniref:C2H2-type domain-containing protein n=1 Tax=Linnemannia gamsii TaxID=64522 RepID=A0ABQ7JRS3_9FUNG|nr:hypothetical protein BGZ96_011694 [Linnemannia gamsii]